MATAAAPTQMRRPGRRGRLIPTSQEPHPKPTIRVELFVGRTLEQKRALAQALTEATLRTLGGSGDAVDVISCDVERHNRATGGQLWSDKSVAPQPG